MPGIEVLGWASAGVFTASYFFHRPEALRRVQMLGASMWALYGLLLHSAPVVVANLMVFGAAILTARRGARKDAAQLAPSVSTARAGDPSPLP